ncbi:ribosome maturation factor RimP [Maritalea sp.]|jgi:ribosome maturation factor RimP|uniref:ribosome maturation factor RimP n=1 Tax=Maritalea sp. TaxID=2003361 RepID=UPI0039E43EF4
MHVELDLKEQRYSREAGQEQRVSAILEPVALDLGYRLVRVRLTQDNGCTLQIMAENAQGEFNISDCEKFSKEISPILDVEDPISREYHLEVSSPGIDRPLVRRSDFEQWIGHEAKIELQNMINGRRRYRGTIEGVEGNLVLLRLPDVPEGQEALHKIDIENLADAKLVMTDKLLDEARERQVAANPLSDPEIETEIDQTNESDENDGDA